MAEIIDPALAKEWEKKLKEAGMPKRLPADRLGQRVSIGLGTKSDEWERREDKGQHSATCPINLGHGISENVDQPNDRPVEDKVVGSRS